MDAFSISLGEEWRKVTNKEKHFAIHFFLLSSFWNEKHLFLPLHMQCIFQQINYFSKHSYSSLFVDVGKRKKSNKNEMNEHLFVWCLSTENSFPYSYVESRENLQLCRKKSWAAITSFQQLPFQRLNSCEKHPPYTMTTFFNSRSFFNFEL